ncbi:MAG: hypothetical protein HC929_18770 [Leptolyngbyaceae cyanobacterium SM2_5_2]|nr:hypothetical protein [Leptolyngbyaceae cyanobacterium SM2_5_2]
MIRPTTVNLHRRIADIPLGWVIAIPLVVSASGAVAGVGYLAYQSGQVAMEELGEQLVEQTNEQISQEITSYLEIPRLINQLNVNTVQRGALDPKDKAALETFLFQQLQQFDQITTLLLRGLMAPFEW